MVIMWPSRGEDGAVSTVTLSQRKAPFETMPRPDPHPPFEAALELSGTSVRTFNFFRPQALPAFVFVFGGRNL
jgi:hypothetical protein